MYNQLSKRWGEQQEDISSIDLLSKKDQQIRRLQAEVQEERRRAQSALKMLESYKNINNQSQQASQGLRGQISRRMKAEQEVKRLKKRNEQLENGLKGYIQLLKTQLQQKKDKYSSVQEQNQE